MELADLAYLQEKIADLEEVYQKQNLANVILNVAKKLQDKRPNLGKEVHVERGYSLIKAKLEKVKGFESFNLNIPIAIKRGDWNFFTIFEVHKAWKQGEGLTRKKLIDEGKIMTFEGEPVAKIIAHHVDDDGHYIIDEAELCDPSDENSLPIVRDYREKKGKPPAPGEEDTRKDNAYLGYPLYPSYHMEVYSIVDEDMDTTVEPRLIQMRFNGKAATAGLEEFVGAQMFQRLFDKFTLKARLLDEEQSPPLYNGHSSIWDTDKKDDEEDIEDDVDIRVFEAVAKIDNLKAIMLSDLAEEYKTFFKDKNGRTLYDRLGVSEVTITKIAESKVSWRGQTVYMSDSSLGIKDSNVKGYLPEWIDVIPPTIPCQALISYYIREEDGVWDRELRKRVEGKTYTLTLTGLKFIEKAGLDEEDEAELEDLLAEADL